MAEPSTTAPVQTPPKESSLPRTAPASVLPSENQASDSQEVDVWLGSFSGWSMLPSWLVCLALTGLIVWGAWSWLPRGWLQLGIFTLVGAVWLVQLTRWTYRIFGYNYRLTNRRLFHSRGFLYQERNKLELADVAEVVVKRSSHERLLHLGRVFVLPADRTLPPVILEGIPHPLRLAEEIRTLARRVREQNITQVRLQESDG